MGHLGIEHGEEFVFADPENAMYNDLDLNRGVVNTFFNPATPFAFKDRLFKKDGMKDLFEVMGKWNKSVYVYAKTHIIPKPCSRKILQPFSFPLNKNKPFCKEVHLYLMMVKQSWHIMIHPRQHTPILIMPLNLPRIPSTVL
mmetsp:Transcript_21221/g.32460  ORF Transcript_21221/g.32460 Transcript_21221/m.32460 type:complete len:142 (+) Transcript_21221:517-942(+)